MSRNFVITKQVTGEGDALNPDEWEGVRYFVWQLESAPTTGQLHYQAYMETDRPIHFSTIQRFPGLEGAHVERRMGTREQARDYCRKKETQVDGPWEYGIWMEKGQGNRSDISKMVDLIKEGKSDQDILDQCPASYVKYYRAVNHIRTLTVKPRDFKTFVYFIYGPSGTGKSRLARDLLPEAYWKQPHSIWWDGYQSSDVIIDDFKGWLPYSDLLRLLDRYPLQVQTKGGQSQMVAKHMAISSTLIPQKWYKPEVHFDWVEFSRRVDRWLVFTDVDKCEEISANEFFSRFVFAS